MASTYAPFFYGLFRLTVQTAVTPMIAALGKSLLHGLR